MSNPKFNSIMMNYFFNINTDVKRLIHSELIESGKDYYDFLDVFLHKYGLSFGVVVNIDNNTYRSYIFFTNENIFNKTEGEANIIEKVTSDEAHEALARKLIELFDSSNYEDWIRAS